MNGGLDRVTRGKKAALPVMGAFEIQAGKIAVWRDYYDMASFSQTDQRELSYVSAICLVSGE